MPEILVTMSRRSSLLAIALGVALAVGSAGCFVRTTPPRQHSHRHGHHGSQHHCHHRAGKLHKRVCHAHPHGPGHH